MSVTSWFLVSSSGTRHRLPREMIFVGRDDCELMLQSRSVDKQHAVINYDPNTDEHMVKDLGSLNGTFVNDLRIPDQTYITLKLSDHEKYTSQLQLSIKALEAKAKEKQQLQSSEKSKESLSNAKLQDRAERRAHSLTAGTDSPVSKPTPLYGQPSWWGEDEDPRNKKVERGGKSPERESPEPGKDGSKYTTNGSLSDGQAKSIFAYRREPSYFEIPTKEFQQRPAKKPESQVHEVPTKDTPDPAQCVPSTPTPLWSKATPPSPLSLMNARQSNASMIRRRSQAEDMYSTNSDPSLLKTSQANNREDGTQSDSGDPTINGKSFLLSEPQIGSQVTPQPLRTPPQRFTSPDSEEPLSYSPPESRSLSSLGKAEPHQAFVIEFFDDHPRKKRSQSFTNNTTPPEPSGLRVQEKTRKTSSPSGERQTPTSASSTPPTQRYTVPLKGPSSTGPQRAGSLRREKTEDRISTSFTSRSTSSTYVRPFSSVGRRSKLAQEFKAEFLKQTKQGFSATCEKNASSSPAAAKTEAGGGSPSSPPPPNAPCQPQTSSPVSRPVPLKAPVMPPESYSLEVKSPPIGPRNEEEDTLSDAGTYTIEADVQDKELEEARNKIDQARLIYCMFIPENTSQLKVTPERTTQTEAETSSAFRPVIGQGREQHRQSSSGQVRPAPEQGQSLVKVQPAGAVLQGGPKWMSCWASLADSYTESGPSSGLFDIPSQMELSGGAHGTIIHKTTLSRNHDSSDSRARRILPQLPVGEKSDIPTPSIHVHCDPHSTFDVEENSLGASRSQDGIHRLSVQDDVEPDSLSDASKSDDGSIVEQKRRPLSDGEEKHNEENMFPAKSTSFYIESEESESKTELGSKSSTPKTERKQKTFSSATLTRPKSNQDAGKVKPSASAPVLGQRTESPESKEGTVSPLIRQESFTKERPSNARLPNISSQLVSKDPNPELLQGACNQDTHSYLKETENVLAALEAKLQAGPPETTPSPIMDSLSGESDVDTSSTVSQHSSKTKSSTVTKRPSVSGLHRERSSASIASQDSKEKRRFQKADSSKSESARRPLGLRRSVGKCGSTDLSDEPHSLPYSDQESNTYQTRRKYTVPLQKEEARTTRVHQALSRANSLSAPRPTRASMLRRARLGEASDNEGTETDRLSQEANNSSAKQPQETKKLSRLDLLAMPRKRTSSFNTPSDTEASAPQWTGRSTGFSNRSTEYGGSSVRRASAPGPKPVDKQQKPVLSKTPLTRVRSGSGKYSNSTASSRRRQKGSGYTSTSDEEYDSNQSTPKHKRSQPSSASHSPHSQPRPQPVVAVRAKPRSRDSEDETQEGGDAFQNWLSQDLAKDLAILAREIHDVAGDGDAQNTGLIQHLPEAGLNYQRVPPCCASTREPDQSSSDHEQSSRQRARSRDEDRVDVWEEIEAKVNSDNDVPVVKTSNKEITSILKELKRVQRQLEVINTVMEPSEQLDASKASAFNITSSSGVQSSRPSSSQDWRTVHSVSKRGGGPRPSDSVRRAAVTPEDLREGYLRATSCVTLAVVLGLLIVLGILLAIAVLKRPPPPKDHETLPGDMFGGNYSTDQCSIPQNITYKDNVTIGIPLEQVWKDLIAMATDQVDVSSFYWTLTGEDININSSSDTAGREILRELGELPSRNVSVRVVTSVPTVRTNSTDLKILKQKGAHVREVNFGRLTKGVLHTKFWIVDRKHVFIGSANMDWRALTQVKELGVVIYNCSRVAEDLQKIFQSYWVMGVSNSSLPEPWPPKYETDINKARPLVVEADNVSSSIYLSASPPSFCPPSRTQDLEAILSTISEAEHYVDVAVMEYFPTTRFDRPVRYWPLIDDAIRMAAFERKVNVRMLISCGRDSDPAMLPFLQSLASLNSPDHHISIEIKLYIVPVGNQSNIPYSRVNHNKYMVTDKAAYIGTSNWSGDYFVTTAGVGLVISQHAPHPVWKTKALQGQLREVFNRDWHSEFAVHLADLGHHPDCSLTLPMAFIGCNLMKFLTELTRLFQKCRTSGSVVITLKKYDGRTKPVPRKGHSESFEPADNKCLIRASDGKKKISTVVSTKEVIKFQMAYSNLLRAHMDGLKKKDKKSKSKKTKATQ
ncbi:hypothetical protein INR49_014262 [Caranx melampygus]|nr:hypothetical protein INR49_014262 [Caranx melampygus]